MGEDRREMGFRDVEAVSIAATECNSTAVLFKG